MDHEIHHLRTTISSRGGIPNCWKEKPNPLVFLVGNSLVEFATDGHGVLRLTPFELTYFEVGDSLSGNSLVAGARQELAVPTGSALDSMTYLDLVRIAWHRKPLFALGIVVALVIGAIYYARATPIYESSAEVLVVKKRPEVVTGEQIRLFKFKHKKLPFYGTAKTRSQLKC